MGDPDEITNGTGKNTEVQAENQNNTSDWHTVTIDNNQSKSLSNQIQQRGMQRNKNTRNNGNLAAISMTNKWLNG